MLISDKIHRSPDCFEIGWPMRRDHDFFCTRPPNEVKKTRRTQKSVLDEEDKKNSPNEDEEMGVS